MPLGVDQSTGCAANPGVLLVVLGPSGSGKDTLMVHAQIAFEGECDVLFVRRTITRPASAGSENHVSMNDAEFDAAIDDGRFALSWAANGLRYGLPREIEAHLSGGKVAVVNGSRGAWSAISQVFPTALAVEIRVEPAVLARRLKARGRESDTEIKARLARTAQLQEIFKAAHMIDNSGKVEHAGAKLIKLIRDQL